MRYAIVLFLAIFLSIGVWYVRWYHAPHFPPPSSQTNSSTPTSADIAKTTIIAENLDTPWGLVFLPDGNILVTERPGRVRIIEKGVLSPTPVLSISTIKELGEGGLLGITLDPKFSDNHQVYLYYTYSSSGSTVYNKVVRMTYKDASLTDENVLVDDIPSSSNHDGGRIKFGPDGYLYVTTGDAENPSQAQNKSALNGKILRMTTDGKVPPGNPFGTFVYSYGHRNSQGLAWDSAGNLWATEHGRSSPLSGFDEINLVKSGLNYGWPVIQGDETKSGMETPSINSGPTTTWAPSGMAYLNGSLFFGGLKGQALYEAVLDGTKIKELKTHLQNQFGRIRDVVVGPDTMLYITTSNEDGRGTPTAGDDKVIRINPTKL